MQWRSLFSRLKKAAPFFRVLWPVLIILAVVALLVVVWWFGRDWAPFGYRPFDNLHVQLSITFGVIAAFAIVWGVRLRRRLAQLSNDREQAERERTDPRERRRAALHRTLDRIGDVIRQHLPGPRPQYRMPWYVVMGLEGAGKSALIDRCGLSYSLRDELDEAIRIENSPFPLEWKVSDQAVLIEAGWDILGTPGADNSEARVLWQGFAEWLAGFRVQRPLNGVVLTLNLASLARLSADDRQQQAELLRDRLRTLMEAANTRVPVYVMLTKLDLLEGFDAHFRHLRQEERQSPMGFTFTAEPGARADAWIEQLVRQYRELVERLGNQLPDVFTRCHSESERRAAFSFPRQLAGLESLLIQYLTDILAGDRLSTPPLVRGTYFSSVYQQGVPENAFIDAASAHYGMGHPSREAQNADNSLRYFVERLWQQIILPEAGLASDNQRIIRRRRLRMAGTAVACLAVGGAVVAGWHHYYGVNVQAAEQVETRMRQFQDLQSGPADLVVDVTGAHWLAPLDQLRAATLAFGEHRQRWTAVADMGLYQGHRIAPEVEQAYLDLLAHQFLPSLMLGILSDLSRGELDEHQRLAHLRVLRMLYDASGRRDDLVTEKLAERWQNAYPGQRDRQERLLTHLEFALAHTDLQGERRGGDIRAIATLAAFDESIRGLQGELSVQPSAERVYAQLQDQAERSLVVPYDLRDAIGPQYNLVFSERETEGRGTALTFPRLLSREGLDGFVLQRMGSVAELALLDTWALGERDSADFSRSDIRQLQQSVRELYARDYVDTWRRALDRIEVQEFRDLNHGVTVLGTLVSSAKPLERLLTTVRHNTRVYEASDNGELSSAALERLPEYQVAQALQQPFANLHRLLEPREEGEASNFDTLMEAVDQVYDLLRGIQEAPDTGKAALGATRSRVTMDGPDPIYALHRLASNAPQPVERMLTRLADETWRVIVDESAAELERLWHQEVYTPYQRLMAGRYPLSPGSSRDVALRDFERFFAPDGILATFYQEHLRLFLEDYPEHVAGNERARLLRSGVVDTLEKAEQIRDAFFTRSGALDVEFTLEPLDLSSNKRRSVINLDGQIVDYSHGPRSATPLIWPNSLRDSAESRITLMPSAVNLSPRSISESGPWALFRLLDRANITGASGSSIDVSFTIDDGDMLYRLYPAETANPFTQRVFAGFSVPRRLY